MKRIGFLGAAALVAVLGLGIAHAAQDRAAPAPFTDKLKTAERQLGTIEQSYRQIEATPEARRDALAGPFEQQQSAYANNMLDQYFASLGQAETLAKTSGKQGTVAGLKAFEDLAQAHEVRLRAVSAKAQKLQPRAAWQPLPFPARMQEPSIIDVAWSYIVPQAHAEIALKVYVVCSKKPFNAVACAQATARGVADGNAARIAYNNCWNGLEGVRPKWLRSLRRAACVTALTIKLA